MDKKLKTIQALRGIAAIAVVLGHCNIYLSRNEEYKFFWGKLLGWGAIGVDLFFVISGFIMIYATNHYPARFSSLKKFIINRAIRILPIYYVVLLILFLCNGAMSTFHYEDKTQDLISAITFFPYYATAAPHYIDMNYGLNVVRWTINYELYFYIIFSICLISKFRITILTIWCLLSVFIIPMILGNDITLDVAGYKVKTAFYGFLSNPIIIEFLIGAISGFVYFKINKYNLKKESCIISISLLIYVFYKLLTGSEHPISLSIAVPVGFLVLFLALSDNEITKFLPKSLLWLGDISFSLYLIHMPLIFSLFSRLGPAENSPLLGIPYAILAISLSIIAAYFFNKYIETKTTKWLKNKIYGKSNHS